MNTVKHTLIVLATLLGVILAVFLIVKIATAQSPAQQYATCMTSAASQGYDGSGWCQVP